MSIRDTETRAVSLVDIPLIQRLSDKATALDSELGYIRDIHGPSGAVVSSLLLPQRGQHTFVARTSRQQVIGQLRLREDCSHAQITYIAPSPQADTDDTAWLRILDAMTREAGKNEIHALMAEVDESSYLFETLRTAGFAVYARQQIWRRQPGTYPRRARQVPLVPFDEVDPHGVQVLLSHIVPPLVAQISTPPSDSSGGSSWVYRVKDRVEAYIYVSEGKYGVYVIPHINPEILEDAASILESALARIPSAQRQPVYVCLRRHQDWLKSTLEDIDFEPGPRQAVMVKHTTARVRQTSFAKVRHGLRAMTSIARSPAEPISQW